MYGMLDMDSIPPATTTSEWPSWIDCAPSITAFIPLAHTCEAGTSTNGGPVQKRVSPMGTIKDGANMVSRESPLE